MSPSVRRLVVLAPIVLLDTAFSLDLLGRLFDAAGPWTLGAHAAAAGVAAGVLAGLPAGTLGAGRGRRLRFAGLYAAGLALFALARWVRGDAAIPPEPVLLAVEAVADALLLAGAWAGGFLDRWLGDGPRGGRSAAGA
jgi:hypothetical protein